MKVDKKQIRCNMQDGKIVSFCPDMKKLLEFDNRVNAKVMVNLSDIQNEWVGAITYKYGRKATDEIAMSYCMFCGNKLL